MERILINICIFMIGSSGASFINVVIDRRDLKKDFILGRSFCPYCCRQLYWYDLVPIFSWINLKGKCRFCYQDIKRELLYTEFIGGIIALFSYYKCTGLFESIIFISFTTIFLMISIVDWRSFTIPNKYIVGYLIIVIFSFFLYKISIADRIAGFFIISIPLCFINQVVHDSFGGGDIKLIAVSGLMLGAMKTVIAFSVAILLATFYVLFKGRINVKEYIAFGPFLSLGIVAAFIYGQNIIDCYTWFIFS